MRGLLMNYRPIVPCALAVLLSSAACGDSDEDTTGYGGAGGSLGGSGGIGGSGGAVETGGSAGFGGNDAGTSGGEAGGEAGGTGGTAQGGSGGISDAGIDVFIDAPPDSDPPLPSPDCDRVMDLGADLAALSDDTEKRTVAEQYLVDIEKSDGFPVRCAPNATFFFRLPAGWGPPHLAGEFNGWNPTAAPMVHVAEDLFQLTLPVDTGPHRHLYKFTDGTNWMADPMARRFGFDSFGEYSLVQGGAVQGHLERHLGVAGNGLPARPLTMYLPPGYETSTLDYPVLYTHDGQNLFDPEAMWGGWQLDEVIELLLDSGQIQPMIVAGIHNTTARFDEYTHVQDLISGQLVGGSGEAYFIFVQTRVMPLVASHYRVKTGPENTWTMGSSLGGLISLYFGLEHADVFGRVAGLSSTLGWGSIGANNPTLMDLVPGLGKPPVVIYLDSGGSDGGGCVDSDGDGVFDDNPAAKDNYCVTVQMRDVLAAAGYTFDVDLFHWHEAGAEHNEAAWSARVALPLKVLAAP